jgi:hypothetical protein
MQPYSSRTTKHSPICVPYRDHADQATMFLNECEHLIVAQRRYICRACASRGEAGPFYGDGRLPEIRCKYCFGTVEQIESEFTWACLVCDCNHCFNVEFGSRDNAYDCPLCGRTCTPRVMTHRNMARRWTVFAEDFMITMSPVGRSMHPTDRAAVIVMRAQLHSPFKCEKCDYRFYRYNAPSKKISCVKLECRGSASMVDRRNHIGYGLCLCDCRFLFTADNATPGVPVPCKRFGCAEQVMPIEVVSKWNAVSWLSLMREAVVLEMETQAFAQAQTQDSFVRGQVDESRPGVLIR